MEYNVIGIKEISKYEDGISVIFATVEGKDIEQFFPTAMINDLKNLTDMLPVKQIKIQIG